MRWEELVTRMKKKDEYMFENFLGKETTWKTLT